ncbi:MAG: 8-amino-7-oxononanoate synthase [Gammaproteobacteria bacterium]
MPDLTQALTRRHEQSLYRQRNTVESPQSVHLKIEGRDYLSFCSNDYLGLANHPEIVAAYKEGLDRFGVGSGSAHLMTGHSYAHQALEEALAEFVGQPRTLLFSTGYMANLGVIDSLVGRSDCVIQDRLNHASLLDGARLSGAQLLRYRHNDMDSLRRVLARRKNCGRRLIATDAVFSMDGDQADLPALLDTAKRNDSWLLVDDAHGFGVLGEAGQGSLSQLGDVDPRVILMATLGKACGISGAFVAGSNDLIETLIQSARTYIYTTATPPAQAWATLTALRVLKEADEARLHLGKLVEYFRVTALTNNLNLYPSTTAIQPLLTGSANQALALSERLKSAGLLVSAIRPPTVPEGEARLRITFSAKHSFADVDRLLDTLIQCGNIPAETVV